ncbi:L-aspartate oxidase [Pseudoxanthomonas japonensis]|nr:L-aspartate oxidase [Pseudoxanthomonas japonensis]
MTAGANHNDYEAVQYLVGNAGLAVRWLQAQGIDFDRDADGLQLGREGGHGCPRIVHAGGDASGHALLTALAQAAQQARHITWRAPAWLDAIQLRDGRISGVALADTATRMPQELACAELVLATGGCGALFAATTNPATADGNGLALALACGARLRDSEFVQFHPTALDVEQDGALPLITEALRGAGARLVDDEGRAVMDTLHPMGDLAPRDHVARRVWEYRQAGGRVWLDATSLRGDWEQRFPTVVALCGQHGIDPRQQRIPVTPAAHFHMGGIAVDLDGYTSVPGLYAVGEVACNGVHGANRLASNSLLEGVVFGRRLGHRLADIRLHAPSSGQHHWVDRGRTADAQALGILQQLAWSTLGPVRHGSRMIEAERYLATDDRLHETWQGKLIARFLLAALQRQKSLGAHFRADDWK